MNLKKPALIFQSCAFVLALVACGGKAVETKETYYYTVAWNHLAGEVYGVDLTNELIRMESETLVLNSDNTFILTFTSSLAGTISGPDHPTGYVYGQSMQEFAVLTGKYSIKSEDSLLKEKVISFDSYTKFVKDNAVQTLDNSDTDGIKFTAKAGQTVSVSTETWRLKEFCEFYEGQYQAANTSYEA